MQLIDVLYVKFYAYVDDKKWKKETDLLVE